MIRLAGSPRSKWKGAFSKIKIPVYDTIEKAHIGRKKLRSLARTRSELKLLRPSIYRHTDPYEIKKFLGHNHSRASVILPTHLRSKMLAIYTGKKYFNIVLRSDHIGYKAGEFTQTTLRGSAIHKNNAKTKKNLKKNK